MNQIPRPQPAIERIDVEAVNAGARRSRPMYESRKKVFPKRAEGKFRRLKWIIMAVTLGIYYLTPWIRWDRGAHAPDQAVLLDMAHRRFYFFFVEIWPQEFPYVAGLLVMAGVGLFLITSVMGRAWCGYACWQTVWTDLFLVVERWVEGDRNARIRLESAPWRLDKIVKRVVKHAVWIAIAVLTGGAWIFYFADAPTLLRDLVAGQAAFIAYSTVAVLAAATYLFGGIMREQVCIYMCPWPRIQAAMLDEDSLVVTYNDWRGEPRSHGTKKAVAAGAASGDCVDCNACVVVCPTGIDIRDGLQLECISCALCIDACDGIMDKLGRERSLVSYTTLRDYNANKALATDPKSGLISPALVRTADGKFSEKVRHFDWRIFLRLRTMIYFSAWAAVGLFMLFALISRDRLEVNVLKDRNPVFVTLSDGSIRNGYTVKLLNMIPEPRVINLSIQGLTGALMTVQELDQPEGVAFAVPVDPDKLRAIKVFVTVPAANARPGKSDLRFVVEDRQSFEKDTYEASFEAPAK